MQRDHGFNGPPAWLVGGSLLARLAPAGDTSFRVLATVDLALFAALFAGIGWAFGPRIVALTLVTWGTQWPFDQTYTFGAFLRQDWRFLVVLSACLAKKRWFLLAGAALAYAGLLRVFPIFLFLPVLVAASVQWAQERRLPRPFARFLAGAALGGLVVAGASLAIAGPRAYPDWAARIVEQSCAPSTNLMGVLAALSW